jgi:hypothetical protein
MEEFEAATTNDLVRLARKTGKHFKDAAATLATLPIDDMMEAAEADAKQIKKTSAILNDYAEDLLSPLRLKIGAPKHEALERAIQVLAGNFEHRTGRAAGISCSRTGKYSGPFVSFVDTVFDMIPNNQTRRMPQTRAALGKAIQRALANRPPMDRTRAT